MLDIKCFTNSYVPHDIAQEGELLIIRGVRPLKNPLKNPSCLYINLKVDKIFVYLTLLSGTHSGLNEEEKAVFGVCIELFPEIFLLDPRLDASLLIDSNFSQLEVKFCVCNLVFMLSIGQVMKEATEPAIAAQKK